MLRSVLFDIIVLLHGLTISADCVMLIENNSDAIVTSKMTNGNANAACSHVDEVVSLPLAGVAPVLPASLEGASSQHLELKGGAVGWGDWLQNHVCPPPAAAQRKQVNRQYVPSENVSGHNVSGQ